jgi:prephenate dehydrogenase
VNWFAALFNLSVMGGAGLIGGLMGKRLRDKGFRPTGLEGT